ncbi:hypothetical protein [Pelagimonas varians]|uniref:Uncharacterized protein n=1 Tax=Pelagimonas varians TaxID=696760 RepID=A0A238KCJ0_9RHOB|nr:hypothetical protein [Pelagimonas varians]PYG29992.1 hypothetical protein C8N36_107158 [Pelagimonas varians]SMX40553.1 hypothetical protein PEV8663_02038 [Pelagimonas varians]
MRKTPLAARFTKQLIRVNDQICFAALQQWDSAKRLETFAKDHPEIFSTEIFDNNPYAKAIHRRAQELPALSRDAQIVALQTGVVASVEHVLAYIQDVQDLRQDLVAEKGETIREDADEEQLRRKIERWQSKPPAINYFRTLGYFRYLRNHYAHVNDKPTHAFETYVRSYGTPLNSFWDNGVTGLHGVEFKSLPTTDLTPELGFGIMNLLRVCLRQIDEMVAESLSLSDTVRWAVMQIRLERNNQDLTRPRLVSKVTTRVKMDWGLECDAFQIEDAVEKVLTDLET